MPKFNPFALGGLNWYRVSLRTYQGCFAEIVPKVNGAIMAKSDFSSRSKRVGLNRGSDWTETVFAGLYLVYRRGIGPQAGSWRARRRKLGSTSYEATPLGVADDLVEPDGKDVLDYDQAIAAARKWADDLGRAATRAAVMGTPATKLTVGDALDHYLEDLERKGRQTETARGIIRAHIRPRWGEVRIEALLKRDLQEWLSTLAQAPRRRTGQKFSAAGSWGDDGPTEEQLRARKVTANRIFAVLSAALNRAAQDGVIPEDPAPWRIVHQFGRVKQARTRFLSIDEQRRLVAACPKDFGSLVQAALHTGSRLGPLTRLAAQDLNSQAGTLFLLRDKGEKSRHLVLAAEGLTFFKAAAKGKTASELVFRRADGAEWTKEMTRLLISTACEAAGIEFLTFHELRHTYASTLVNAGVPLAFVAAQLGHVDTRMVELHYGHLANSAVAESIRRLTPTLGLDKKKR
jgi:integrase